MRDDVPQWVEALMNNSVRHRSLSLVRAALRLGWRDWALLVAVSRDESEADCVIAPRSVAIETMRGAGAADIAEALNVAPTVGVHYVVFMGERDTYVGKVEYYTPAAIDGYTYGPMVMWA